jgi:signal transduction histidine kinase
MTIELLDAKTLRVVIIDDTADLRELLRFALTRGGMAVVGEAGDGVAGIEVVRAARPDIVLLDLSMPVMDGLEALPKIRALAPDARIIVLSGFEATAMAERAVAIGADGYLQKGASLGRILDQIRDIVASGANGSPQVENAARPLPLVRAATSAAPQGPVIAVAPQSSVMALAPFGVVEVDAEEPYRVISANSAAAGMLVVDPEPGEPLERVAPEISAAIVNSRLAGDGDFEATLGEQAVLVSLRHTPTTLMLYLQTVSSEVKQLKKAIATTAHEIRGPVSVLCAITETILEDALDSEHVDRLMLSVSRQARLLDSITGDLLAAAQVQRGTLRIDTRDLDPRSVVTAVIEDHRIDTESVDVSDLRWVRADPLRLQQMLGNLITNARKYGEPPIRMRVRTSTEHEALVCIDVEDSGPGVPDDFVPHLFREFSRAGGTEKVGTGLGLSVVQFLAQGQGGSVSYAHRPGGGSVFTISLPAVVRRASRP